MVAGSHALATKFLTLTGLGGEHIIIMCIPGTSQPMLFNYKYKPSATQNSGGSHV